MGSRLAHFQQNRFDLGRKHVYAADDQHIVRPAQTFFHPDNCPPAGTLIGLQHSEVARAIAQQRQRFFGQACKNKFARGSVRKNFLCNGIYDFRNEMIFKDVKAALMRAFCCNTRTDNFAKPVNIERFYFQFGFDFPPHFFRPRLCAEDSGFEFKGLDRHFCIGHCLCKKQCVGGSTCKNR